MFSQTILAALFAALVDARFGQEQGNGAITAIGALTDLGTSGQAATLAGGSIQFLLAAANPCGKLSQADNIITELGNSDRAIAAARGLVAAEQNFNPFVVSVPSVCSDPTLPTTLALRGIVPLIDPAVGDEATENTNSNTSIVTPFTATGLSVAQVMIAQGFSSFTAVALDGTKQAASVLGAGVIAPIASNSTASALPAAVEVLSSTVAPMAEASSSQVCGGTTFVTITRAATSTAVETPAAASTSVVEASATSAAPAVSTDAASAGACTGSGSTLICTSPAVGSGSTTGLTGTFTGFVASTINGLDFGLCVPTMKFEAGLDGRAATAFTFQAQDPLCNKGQEEALNPSIITNRIHDQLTNACGANQAAKDATAAAQVAIAALGTRDVTTANAWNTMLGFEGANTNPDNAPVTGLVGHA